jgi:hypothetical protein
MTDALSQSSGDMKDILDIEPVLLSLTAHWIRIGLAALGILAVLALAYASYRYVKKRRAMRITELSPYGRALKDLEALRKSRHYAEREWAPFYFLLTEAFKRFVSGHCGMDVSDKTTEEVIRMKVEFARIADEADWERVKSFLSRGDQVKFAKAEATPVQAAEDFDFVENFVRKAPQRKTSESR